MKYLVYLIFSCLLASCLSHEQKITQKYGAQPEWTKQTPLQQDFYVGIANCNKNNPDYKNIAARIALENLASDISVEISGESILNTKEINQQFQQEFSQNILIRSKAELEGYELIDDWEDEENYYVFYQLSKSKYDFIRREKTQKAVLRAKELYLLSLSDEKNGEVKNALVQCVKGLDILSPYFNQSLKTELEGKTINLVDELFLQIGKLQQGIIISPAHKELNIKLGDAPHPQQLYFICKNTSGLPLNSIPIAVMYGKSIGFPEIAYSNPEGKVFFSYDKKRALSNELSPSAQLDMNSILKESTQNRALINLLSLNTGHTSSIQINIAYPKIYIEGEETNESEKPLPTSSSLLAEIKKSLLQQQFELSSVKNKADLVLIYKIKYGSALNLDGLTSIHSEGEITLYKNDEIIYSASIPKQNGIHLTTDEALAECRKKLGLIFYSRVSPELANRYFGF